jgi:cell division transport system permease protein
MITLACYMTQVQEKHTQRKLRTSSASTVISISLVLFMLGILGLVLINAQRLSNYVKENIGFTVMLKEDVKEIDVLQFQKTLDASDWVKASQYVSKEEAATTLQQDLGEDFLQFLGFNPLSSSLDLHLHAAHTSTEQLTALEQELKQHHLVKDVVFQKDLVEAINQNVKKMSLLLLGFCALLFVIAIALINNTIRLSVYSKRFLIRTMKLVGATNGFIRKPFMYSGITQGIFGALIGILLLMTALLGIQQEMPELLVLQDLPTVGVILGAMLAFGILMSLLATNIAVGKYLRMNEDDLYR